MWLRKHCFLLSLTTISPENLRLSYPFLGMSSSSLVLSRCYGWEDCKEQRGTAKDRRTIKRRNTVGRLKRLSSGMSSVQHLSTSILPKNCADGDKEKKMTLLAFS
ncbi:hypothetical protein WUBG_12615 [Wuchereria bancrofti]|uniref:Uncharacterized protein n=1 Tax=Wuchereria bancrofti TaxID=6293 RepID=J9E2K9_WUCBA|nr:hypothetical protein WUBG_12615 [Wuchereria bancrofti]